MLSPYRILDLTDEKGLLCGKLLGDLGADVIKVERPSGDPSRNIGPFYRDEPDREMSLFWWAFNTSKRGITLDIETPEGQGVFKRMVESADVVIESFLPGYMDKLGLGYPALKKINPSIILVSITPFGQTGPHKDFKAPDIIAWAMGGQMYSCGDANRPPIHMSHHSQAYLHAGAEAAVGTMLALYHLNMTGEGQQVDISIQACLAQATQMLTAAWDMMKIIKRRGGALIPNVKVHMTRVWSCKDGYAYFLWWRGFSATWNQLFLDWMDDEGTGDDFLKNFDWSADWTTTTQEEMDRIEEPTCKFFMSKTKAKILRESIRRRLMLYPVSNIADIVGNTQLAARGFWVKVEHPELGTSIIYPGPFAQASEAPPRIYRRAPLIGEHNEEIFKKELSLSKKELLALRQTESYSAKPRKRSYSETKPQKPLEGIKVADFTWALVGPITTKVLSDWGAEVVKIESKNKPDSIRIAGPFKDGIPGLERSGDFAQYNTGKFSVALNLTHPKGIEIAKRLVAWADIVVDNFAGGVMERMGLGYEELKKIKPDIIMLSSCMQGQTGPHAFSRGNGYLMTALSGFLEITGWPDREPKPPEGPYIDFIAPRFNALAILAAIDYHRRTGRGQYLDLSQFENGVHFLTPLVLDYVVNKRVATRMGNRYPYAAPHGAYRCLGEDRWCVIAVLTNQEWESFCKVIGHPAWAKNPKFSTLPTRKENEDELDRLVEEWTITHSAEEVMNMMQVAGVAAGVVENGEDLLENDPQLKHRKAFQEIDHPEIGKHRAPKPHFILSKSPCRLRRAPMIGEHNEYVLKEILGISDYDIAEFVIEGVLE